MHVIPLGLPCKTQLHSRKYHFTYNGASRLPQATWVRSPTVLTPRPEECMLVYEVVLYYGHNRACTIYRTWDDFRMLRCNSQPGQATSSTTCCDDDDDVQALHCLLLEALAKRPEDCALEYFLRRRMEDCDGSRCC